VSISGKYGVAGQLLDEQTKEPIASATVLLMPVVNAPQQPVACRTDSEGLFRFEDVPAGKYTLAAQRHGHNIVVRDEHGQFSSAVVAGPGLDSTHILFLLPAEARISGTVSEDEGDPVPRATVLLLRSAVVDGKRCVTIVNQLITSENGAYRFPHLKPGTYYVAVSAQPWFARNGSVYRPNDTVTPANVGQDDTSRDLDVAYPVTYSGGATSGAAAQPIQLRAGDDVSSDVVLHPVPALHVRVEKLNEQSPPGYPEVGAFSVVGPGGVRIQSSAQVQSDSSPDSGTVDTQVVGISPGSYRIVMPSLDANGTVSSSSAVYDLGPGSVLKPIASGVKIAGRVTTDGQVTLHDSQLHLQSVDDGQVAERAAVSPSGSFHFTKNVSPGLYSLVIENTPNLKVTSISDGHRISIGSQFTIGDDSVNAALNLLIQTSATSTTSRVPGVVTRDGKPLSGAMVLLLPAQVNEDTFIGRDQSDSDGTFTIANVPPGTYTVVAIEGETADFEYRNPSTIGPYLAAGQKVVVPPPPGSTAQVVAQSLRSPTR
jgi:hypothetical protein